MKKRMLLLLCMAGAITTSVKAQYVQIISNMRAPQSQVYEKEEGGFSGYVRASAYGFGQSSKGLGSENYDYSSTFAEAMVRANFKKSALEGYVMLAGEARLRHGQYFNGKLDTPVTTNTAQMYHTDLELRDLYVGYRSRKLEVTFGNQNIQWGRGIGSNPTNNLSPTNLMFLSANSADKRMYNLMLSTNYKIHDNLDWSIVAIPLVKSSYLDLRLFNLGGSLNMSPHELPDADFKNGAIATKLNWNLGPIGGSVSYFNGYDPFPTLVLGISSTGATGHTLNYQKQTFGGDFGIRIPGKVKGDLLVTPTNDLMIFGEAGYNKTEGTEVYVPESNLAFSLGFIKMVYAKNQVDKFTGGISWYGKYTPNYATLIPPDRSTIDPNNPATIAAYGKNFLEFTNKTVVRFFQGQQSDLDSSLMFILSQSFAQNKVGVSVTYNYGLLNLPGPPEGHNSFLSPRVNWNITKMLTMSGGALHMWGPSANNYGPIMGGYFCELKASL